MSAPDRTLTAREAREKADNVGLATEQCSAVLEAAQTEFQRVRQHMKAAPRVDWSSPEEWRQFGNLLGIALEKANEAVEWAEGLAGANVKPDAHFGPDPEAKVLRGAEAVAEHLGVSAGRVSHLDKARQLPTFHVPGDNAPLATVAGLDDWRRLDSSRELIG